MTRSSALRAGNSYNTANRTFRGVLTTFAPVERKGYTEALDPSTFDIESCLNAPIMIEHNNSVGQTVGRITKAFRNGDLIEFEGQLIDSPQTKHVQELLAQGLIRGVSIGYSGRLGNPISAGRGNSGNNAHAERPSPVRLMSNVRIHEVSLTQQPADTGCIIRSKELNTMQKNNDSATAKVEYRAEVRSIAKKAGLSAEWADAQIDNESDLTAVKAAAFDNAKQATRAVRSAPIVTVNAAPATDTRAAVEDALYSRMTGSNPANALSRHYRSMSMKELAANRLEERGISARGLSGDEIFNRSVGGGLNTVSDFPALLSSAGQRVLLDSYAAAASPVVSVLTRSTTMSDFRTNSRIRLSGIGALAEVPEGGEITNVSRSENVESYSLSTFARIFSLSRQALINDDLGAFNDFSRAAGVAAANTEADLLVGKLTANPKMGDGKQAFSASHGNSGDGALTVAGLSDARLALRNMRGEDGSLINVQPRYLLVGSALETTAEQLLAQIYATTPTDSNPFSGKLTLLVDPRISDKSWYLFADPAVAPVLERAYLSSASGVQIAQEDSFDMLATRFRVHLDVGAGLIDFRGAVLNVAA